VNWEQIYLEYWTTMIDIATPHVHDRPDLDAADVVHDTFIAAICNPPVDEPDWQEFLTQLMAKTCFDCREPVPDEEVVPIEDPAAIAIRRVDAGEVRRRALRVMSYMTPRQREITHLRLFEGLSVGEIANIANTSSSNISQIVIRCLNKLGPIFTQLDLFDQHDLELMRPPRRPG
jgi:RNA polymerase sigma factor (sigma-70 family)